MEWTIDSLDSSVSLAFFCIDQVAYGEHSSCMFVQMRVRMYIQIGAIVMYSWKLVKLMLVLLIICITTPQFSGLIRLVCSCGFCGSRIQEWLSWVSLARCPFETVVRAGAVELGVWALRAAWHLSFPLCSQSLSSWSLYGRVWTSSQHSSFRQKCDSELQRGVL